MCTIQENDKNSRKIAENRQSGYSYIKTTNVPTTIENKGVYSVHSTNAEGIISINSSFRRKHKFIEELFICQYDEEIE